MRTGKTSPTGKRPEPRDHQVAPATATTRPRRAPVFVMAPPTVIGRATTVGASAVIRRMTGLLVAVATVVAMQTPGRCSAEIYVVRCASLRHRAELANSMSQ